jgi:hypothetical protein
MLYSHPAPITDKPADGTDMSEDEHPYKLPYFHEALLQAGIAREPPGGTLFHYTSSGGLRDILGEGCIWATHADFFNDTSEYEFGLSLLPHALDRMNTAGFAMFRPLIDQQFVGRRGYDIYASCFSEKDDLLPQWRGYAADGAGYSLGFPAKALSREGAAGLLPVTYGEEAVGKVFARMVDWAIDRMGTLKGSPNVREEVSNVLSALATSLFLLVVASKKEVFAHECEWRLIHLVDRDVPIDQSKIAFRTTGGVLVPYVSLSLPRSPDGALLVSSIRTGPTLHDSVTKLGVEMLLAKHGIQSVPVLKSDAPLRR